MEREAEAETNHEGEVFSEFPQLEVKGAATPGEFASAQWREPNLEHARRNVSAIDDQRCEGVSNLTFPHF